MNTRGGRGGAVPNSPDRLTYQRALFRTLLMDAYGVQRDQIQGPGWATADAVDGWALFDVSAKVFRRTEPRWGPSRRCRCDRDRRLR